MFTGIVAVKRRVARRQYALNRLHEETVIRRNEEYRGARAGAHPVYHAEFGLHRGGVRYIPDCSTSHSRDEHTLVLVQMSERDRHDAVGRIVSEITLPAVADGKLRDCRGSSRQIRKRPKPAQLCRSLLSPLVRLAKLRGYAGRRSRKSPTNPGPGGYQSRVDGPANPVSVTLLTFGM